MIRALSASNVIEIGKQLSEVRSALSQKGGAHKGEWLRWLKREVGFSEHTARRHINVFEVFGSNATRVSHWNIPLRSLYELAAPTTPEPARLQVLKDIEEGKKLPYREITAIIAAHNLKEAEQRDREGEAERLGGLHVDDQFDFRDLLDRQVGRLVAFENPAGVVRCSHARHGAAARGCGPRPAAMPLLRA